MDGGQYGRHGFEPAAPPRRSAWRFFPWAVTAALGIVMAVNVGLVVMAVRSFPGAAPGNGFALSNAYNEVLRSEARQEALGWTLQITLDEAWHPVVMLTDRDGRALTSVIVEANAARPLGPPQTTPLSLRAISGGRYLADAALTPGQWDVTLRATQGEDRMHAVRRLVVR
jgi:nitrogen fixation protein FixH